MGQEPILIKFGAIAKEARLARGLTQLELADKFGSAEATISRLEKGRLNPSLLWILKFADALEIEPTKLLDQLK